MRIISYFKNSKAAVLLVVCLLIVQAATDLSLPRLTSDIVDVGIQQSGIEHASPEEMRSGTHDAVCMMLSADDEAEFATYYAQGGDGAYYLTDAGSSARDRVDDLVALPLVVTENASKMEGFDLDAAVTAYQAGMLSKNQVSQALAAITDSLGENSDLIIRQQGIAAAKAEYEALGLDVSAIQMNYLLHTGAAMLGLAALGMAAAVAVGFLASRTAAKIGYTLREKLFSRVLSFSEADINRFSAASLITRGTNDITLIQNVSVMLQRMVLYAPILGIGGIIMITQTNVSMAWIIVVAVVAVLALVLVLFAAAMPKFKVMQKLIDRVNLVARELLTGLPVVRAFGREKHEEARFDEASRNLMKTQLFTNRVMTFMMPCMMLIMNCVSVAIVWFGGICIDEGTLQTGDLIAFITYAMVIIMGFLMIGMISIMLPRANVAAERVDEVIACEPAICDPESPRDDELSREGAAPGAKIEFKNVTFTYRDASAPAVEHITFTAEAGKTTAIIGATGSGKSTIAKLMMRFYDVSSGTVSIDGIDVRELSQHALRAQMGYVPQKAFLFSGTVESNVAYSDEDMGGERVSRALEIAQAADFVGEMPEGAASAISQGGTNVSGGQRQRLAIARALAVPARAFVFDDSFSALDYKTDATLRLALAEKLAGRTVIIVAQRISTIMHADTIVVLDDGRMCGVGTHDELMETCDEYREIALSQLSEEELKGGDAR